MIQDKYQHDFEYLESEIDLLKTSKQKKLTVGQARNLALDYHEYMVDKAIELVAQLLDEQRKVH